ncbi:MAG: ferritin family protein [Phycisphaerae bacterium]
MPDPSEIDAAAGRGPDKLLAMGIYGETVAAYRYSILAEKALIEAHRREFAEMADEEQGHKQRLQILLDTHYPDADFVLTPEDKGIVASGTRLIEIRDEADYADAMRMILMTERRTARFYANHGKHMHQEDVRSLFHELAEEGAEHYQRLKTIARQAGVTEFDEP